MSSHIASGPAIADAARVMQEPLQTDWLVIGSGFGGSVAALRLAEKGYSVSVLERGRRFADDDFAETAWQLRRVLWWPRLGLRGIMRLTPFRHVTVLSGVGVGGGSLVYGNTLYVPSSDAFYRHPQWAGLADWRAVLAPHYETAKRMLGAVPFEGHGASEALMASLAGDLGVADTVHPTDVGVWFGRAGQTVSDPYFGGAGPDRTGCVRCGQCMLGCRYGAKNTLVKNYLALGERLGVRILPERQVTDIRPLGALDGSDGYAVTSERSGWWWRGDRQVCTTRGVVVAGGALGTAELLRACRDRGSLPALSNRLGDLVRTNSEAITAVTAPRGTTDLTSDLAITTSLHPDADTHVTNNTYGVAGDALALSYGPLTGGRHRIRQFLFAHVRRPDRWMAPMRAYGWSRRTVIFTVMQSSESSLRLRPSGRRGRLQTELADGPPPASHLPIANAVAELAARRTGGVAQTSVLESLRGAPTTAHLLGGAVIGADADTGVVDRKRRAFGYRNLLITDGSTVPANVGVNPSLTITALGEEAMTHVPQRPADLAPAIAPAPPAASALRTLRRTFQEAQTPTLEQLVGLRQSEFAGPLYLRALGPVAMATTGMPSWFGKRFRASDIDELEGENILRRGGALVGSIPMRARLEPATCDGRPALVVRYPPGARWPWRRVRDELRPLSDGRLLGLTYGLPGTSPRGVPFILHPPSAADA